MIGLHRFESYDSPINYRVGCLENINTRVKLHVLVIDTWPLNLNVELDKKAEVLHQTSRTCKYYSPTIDVRMMHTRSTIR
jgi:hypothetical protein